MENTYTAFLNIWNYIVLGLSVLSLLTGIVIFIYHAVKQAAIKEYKAKYDYLRDYDSKMIFYGIFAISLAIALFANTQYKETVTVSVAWFFIRLFISVGIGTLLVYLAYMLLKYAYPTTLNKKLKKWRYMPRVNPKTGNTMKLLSEEEEDVHLDEGMQAEEDVFSVDYDVWFDPETNDVHIEKYPGHLEAQQCNSCGFMTMKQIREEILKLPTEMEEGETVKYYQCSYCKSKRTKTLKIAKIEPDGIYKLPDHILFKEDEKVHAVTVEIHIGNGKSKVYEFSSTEQASNFLKEFEMDNMA